jgi:hypothetical protein
VPRSPPPGLRAIVSRTPTGTRGAAAAWRGTWTLRRTAEAVILVDAPGDLSRRIDGTQRVGARFVVTREVAARNLSLVALTPPHVLLLPT